MIVRVRKIVYQVHMDTLDDGGNVVGEMQTEQPLSLYAHQLSELPERVATILKQAEEQ